MYRIFFKYDALTGWHVSACWPTTSRQVVYRGAHGSLGVLCPVRLSAGAYVTPLAVWRHQRSLRRPPERKLALHLLWKGAV